MADGNAFADFLLGYPSNASLGVLEENGVSYVTSKEAGYDRSLQRPNFNRVAPRFGLAWSPRGSDRTVMRAGFGLFYNQAAYGIQTGLALNLPFYFNKSVTTAADTQIPTLTTANILQAPTTGSIGGDGLNYEYRSEYAESWTFSLQRMLSDNWAAQATYFGSKVVGAPGRIFGSNNFGRLFNAGPSRQLQLELKLVF